MTGLLVLPTKTAGSIGQVKNTLPEDVGVEFDLDYYETAAEAERQKDALIAMAARLGLGDGTTPGSFEAMKAGLEAGTGLRLMTLDGSGAYASIRIQDSFTAPTSAHGYAAGFRVGSWWVERGPGEGPGVPGPITLWVCVGDTDGAASWQVMPSPSDALPLAGAASAGTSPLFARADHKHPGALSIRSVSTASALTTSDDILLVSTAAASVPLTLPSPASVKLFVVKKTTTDTHTIVLTPHDTGGSGPSVEGGAAGGSFTLPSSDVALRGSWTVVSDGAAWWLV